MAYVYLVICLFSVFSLSRGWAECVEKKKFVPVQGTVGMYLRVHPGGNFVLSSVGGRVRIYDLTKSPAATVETPMQSETYPVEGSWRLFASPNHGDGMRYYSFSHVLSRKSEAAPVFSDAEHNQFYHSAAEFPDSTAEKMKFRTVLWNRLTYRDYTVSMNDGVATVEKSQIRRLCSTLTEPSHVESANETQQRARLAELGNRQTQVEQEMFRVDNSWRTTNDGNLRRQFRNRLNELQSQWVTQDQELRTLRQEIGQGGSSGSNISQPIISKDGQFVAGSAYDQSRTNQTTQIFKIDGSNCVRVADMGFLTGKVSFAYPDGGSKRVAFAASSLALRQHPSALSDQELQAAMDRNASVEVYVRDGRARGMPESDIRRNIADYLANSGGQGIYTYDIDSKKIQNVSEAGENPTYPGYTKDGRIIYGGYQNQSPGFFIVDPNQMEGGSGQCITKEQAAAAAGTAAAH